jgi:hypothetical protein
MGVKFQQVHLNLVLMSEMASVCRKPWPKQSKLVFSVVFKPFGSLSEDGASLRLHKSLD